MNCGTARTDVLVISCAILSTSIKVGLAGYATQTVKIRNITCTFSHNHESLLLLVILIPGEIFRLLSRKQSDCNKIDSDGIM